MNVVLSLEECDNLIKSVSVYIGTNNPKLPVTSNHLHLAHGTWGGWPAAAILGSVGRRLDQSSISFQSPRWRSIQHVGHVVLMAEGRCLQRGHRTKPHKHILRFCTNMAYSTAVHILVAKASHMAMFVPKIMGQRSILYLQRRWVNNCEQIVRSIIKRVRRLLLTVIQ